MKHSPSDISIGIVCVVIVLPLAVLMLVLYGLYFLP